jgi:signal transduction histidine kinase
MSPPKRDRLARFGLRFALALGAWTLLGLLEASHTFARNASQGKPTGGWRTLALGLSLWYTWALLAWLLYRLIRRFPFEQRTWPRRLLLYSAVCPLFVLVKLAVDYPIIKYFYCSQPERLTFARFYPMAFTDQFHSYVLIYWALVGALHALNYYRRYRERELRASQLETRLAQAQLQLLKMQLHPHFLFNTLNAISALIHENVDVADNMVARLGDLLRLTLEHEGIHEVALHEELEFIQTYLEIEQVRFGPRLAVQVQIHPETLDARVPYLVLQPLVENAIRHGISPVARGGCVAVRARAVGEVLRLEVEDSGPGLTPRPPRESPGIGLPNTRARLEQLYGAEHRFELGRGQLGGLLVTIEIPFDREPVAPPDVLLDSAASAH